MLETCFAMPRGEYFGLSRGDLPNDNDKIVIPGPGRAFAIRYLYDPTAAWHSIANCNIGGRPAGETIKSATSSSDSEPIIIASF